MCVCVYVRYNSTGILAFGIHFENRISARTRIEEKRFGTPKTVRIFVFTLRKRLKTEMY